MDILYKIFLLSVLWAIFKLLFKFIGYIYLNDTLYNKRILITGCDTGFGNEMAIRFSLEGAYVFAGCYTEEGIKSLNLKSDGRIHTFLLDVSKELSIKQCAQNLKDKLGGRTIDVLINNAGISNEFMFELTPLETHEKILNTNYFGTVKMTKYILPLLTSPNGRIINIGSSIVFTSIPCASAYTASKYAISGFSKVLRLELLSQGIKVIEIQPGVSNTNIIRNLDFDLFKKWYSDADDQLKNRYNGIKCIESFKLTQSISSAIGFKPRNIVKPVKNAIVSRFPANKYIVGLNAKLWLRPISYLPEIIMETIYCSLY